MGVKPEIYKEGYEPGKPLLLRLSDEEGDGTVDLQAVDEDGRCIATLLTVMPEGHVRLWANKVELEYLCLQVDAGGFVKIVKK